MRVLWVKLGGLWPLNTGARLRSFHTIAQLSKRHELSVVTTHAPDEDPEAARAALPDCERVVSVPFAPAKQGSSGFVWALAGSWVSPLPVDLHKWRSPELQAEAAGALHDGGCDLCVADFLTAVPNLPSPCPVPVVLLEHNVEHLIWRRLIGSVPLWQRPALALEWRKLRRYEARACARAKLTVAVSGADRSRLAELAPGATLGEVSTGVDTDYFVPSAQAETDASLVFSGAMDWYPNEDASRYLIDAILPRIRREAPGATLTLVGRNPSKRLRSLAARSGVEVTGTVVDVRPHVGAASVVVVPLRAGSGTRLKILEALAMGKAVVSTTVGAEGLPLVPGEHYVRADEPPEFAAAVVALLRDPARREALGTAGRRLVEERHGWPRVAREFEALCHQAIPDVIAGISSAR